MRLGLGITLLAFLTLACAHKDSHSLPLDIAAFSSHLSYDTETSIPTFAGSKRLENRAYVYKVDLPFDNALRQIKPILGRHGWKPTPVLRAGGMRTVRFNGATRFYFGLSHLDSDPPNTSTLVYGFPATG